MRKRTSWRVVALTTWLVTGLIGAHDAAAQPAPTDRIVVRVDVGSRPASRNFASTTGFTLFSEPGSLRADYEIQPGSIFEGGIAFRFWRNLAVGLDVSSYQSRNPAQVGADLPHPFLFDFPRTTTGVARGLERQELSLHVRALWMMRLADWLVVSVSGGSEPYYRATGTSSHRSSTRRSSSHSWRSSFPDTPSMLSPRTPSA